MMNLPCPKNNLHGAMLMLGCEVMRYQTVVRSSEITYLLVVQKCEVCGAVLELELPCSVNS